MARPIKETPILFGEDAKRFLASMQNVKPASQQEKQRVKAAYEKLKKILKPLSIIFLVCFLVSGATELCIVIDEDHFITNRNGTNEHVIDLMKAVLGKKY